MKLDKIANLLNYCNTNYSQTIEGLAYKLGDVGPNFIFFAKSGDPIQIEEAIKKGATAIVANKTALCDTPLFTTASTTKALAKVAHSFYEKPSQKLTATGILGTSGKSTLSQLIQQIYKQLNVKSSHLEKNEIPTALEINKLLVDVYENQVKNAIIEICLSHIVDNHLDHTHFTTLIHTTTSPHLKMEDKWNLTKPFIRLGEDQTAIINLDDPLAPNLQEATVANVITYGTGRSADIRAQNINQTMDRTTFDLYQKESFICQLKLPLLGLYNVYNTLALLAYFSREGYQLEVIVNLLEDILPIGGRLEKINSNAKFNVMIDHADEPCALESVLKSLSVITKGKVIALLPANGGKTRDHLSQMGKIALANSTHVIFTGKPTPRDDAHRIIYDMLRGNVRDNYTIVIDQERAILKALKMAEDGDTVILLEKEDQNHIGISTKRIAQYTLEKLQP